MSGGNAHGALSGEVNTGERGEHTLGCTHAQSGLETGRGDAGFSSSKLSWRGTWKTLQFHSGKHRGRLPPQAQSDKKSNLGVMEQKRMGEQEVGEKRDPTLGFRPSLLSPHCLFKSHLLDFFSSSVWWTVLRIGGGGLVSRLPWQLQQSTNLPVLRGGTQGLW